MTTGEYLSSISTVSNTTAMTHFLNISTGTGGGGELSILEAVFINEEQPIMLDAVSDNIEVREEPDNGSVIIEEDVIIIEIIEDEGDVIDVIH